MSIPKLTGAMSLALIVPSLALLALSAYYAGGVSLAVAGAGALALLMHASVYMLFTSEVVKPLTALAGASSGTGPGLPAPGRWLPAEIESIKSYVLSAGALLDEYREQHRDLITSIPDILLELDRSGVVIFANRTALETTGYAEEELLGRPFLSFVALEWRPAANAYLSTLQHGESVINADLKLVLKNRSESFFEFNAVPLWKNGAVAGCCCIGRDIEERRKIMHELESARKHAEEATAKLKKTVSDLEEFSLLAVRRELKMQELREMFVRLKENHEINKEFPS